MARHGAMVPLVAQIHLSFRDVCRIQLFAEPTRSDQGFCLPCATPKKDALRLRPMIAAQTKITIPTWRKVISRVLTIVVVALVLGYGIRHLSAALERSSAPAGFGRGMLQGAMMPCALPNLLVGHDVSIYNQNNTGVPYKLGYTCGVNTCGAVFFGLFFLRVNRLRKHWRRT